MRTLWLFVLLGVVGLAVLLAFPWKADGGGPKMPEVLGEGGFPREVRLLDGRVLNVPRPPTHIVPASAIAVDMVCALVSLDRIAALPKAARGYYSPQGEGMDALEVSSLDQYAAEPLLVLQPDLVVTHLWQAPETTEALVANGIPVLALPDVVDLPGILTTLELLGRILDAEDEARELAADLERRAAALAEQARRRAPLTVISYSNYGGGGWTAGRNTTTDTMIGLAGLRNLSAEYEVEQHQRLDFEQIIRMDPDLILVASAADDDSSSPSADLLRSEPVLARLRAVREGRILILPARLASTGSHYLVEAAEALAAEVDRLLAAESAADAPSNR